MDAHEHHEELIETVQKEQKEVLESSSQAIYIYLDDNHKICNEKFAQTLGYSSADEWAKKKVEFVEEFVADDSAKVLVSAYTRVIEKLEASEVSVTWKKKDGTEVKTSVIIAPIASSGHIFAIHFVSPK